MDTEETKPPTKLKIWWRHYGPLLVVGSVTSSLIGLITYASYKTAKAAELDAAEREAKRQARLDEFNRWFVSEQDAGNAIYPQYDGSFLVVPQSEAKIIWK